MALPVVRSWCSSILICLAIWRQLSQSIVHTFLFGEVKNLPIRGETPLDAPSGIPLLLDRPDWQSAGLLIRKVGDLGGVLLTEQLECLLGTEMLSMVLKIFQKHFYFHSFFFNIFFEANSTNCIIKSDVENSHFASLQMELLLLHILLCQQWVEVHLHLLFGHSNRN